MAALTFSVGSAVYVHYKDHVLFKNITSPVEAAMDRETIGWLTKQNEEIILIEHDRPVQDQQIQSKQQSGLIILKNCILEIRQLPLQNDLEWHLNSQKVKGKAEYALQKKKRKTQNSRKGANR